MLGDLQTPQLDSRLVSVSELLSHMASSLLRIEDQLRAASTTREDEVIVASFGTGASYVTPAQLRVTSLRVYTSDAGLFRVQIGSDASMAFLSTVNGNVTPINGDNERVIIARGMPLTIVPPSGTWYATLYARAGVTYGRQA